VLRKLHRLLEIRAERHDAVFVDVPCRENVAVAIPREAQLLLRDDVHVASVPDLDVRWILIALNRVGFLVPSRHADKDDAAVF